MKRAVRCCWRLAWVMLALCLCVASPSAGAESGGNGAVAEALRRAVELRQGARASGSMAERDRQLGEARALLIKLVAEQADPAVSDKADLELAEVLMALGQSKSEQAARANRSPQEQQVVLGQARELYQEARQRLEAQEKRLAEAHAKFPQILDPKDTKLIEERDLVRRDWLSVRLALPTVLYEMAHTYAAGSAEFEEHLKAAALQYNALYKKQANRLAGLRARLGEGRCYRELGQESEALSAFEDLVSLLEEPEGFRAVKNLATMLYLETAIGPKVGKHREAMEKYQAWVKTAREEEAASAEGLAIKYFAGVAALELAQASKKDDVATRTRHLKLAKTLLDEVAQKAGTYQRQAQAALRRPEFGGEEAGGVNAEAPREPTSFAEAQQRGRAALERLQEAELKPAEAAQVRTEAQRYLKMAVAMRTADVTAEDLNAIRYYLAYLHWSAQEWYEAATLGEFLARRYPKSAGARPGAKIALASYARLFNAAPAEDRKFETARMVELASYMTAAWKGEPEADDAWMMLVQTALSVGQLDKAREYLQQIPEDSPRRADVEMTAGRKLWAEYLSAARKPQAQRLPPAQLDALLQQARQLLDSGVGRMRKAVESGGGVSESLLASALALVQSHVGTGEAEKAVALLEDPKIGLLKMTAADQATSTQNALRVEAYKAALRAYVATRQLDKAEGVLKSLETGIKQAGDAEASAKLTRIYIGLGRELEEQLRQLRSEEKTAELEKVSRAFELFLDRIAQRPEGNTFGSLTWVAETYYRMGAGFDLGGTKLSVEANKYYGKAAQTYESILQLCADKKIEGPPNSVLGIQIRLANCLRRQGHYHEAMKLLVGILKAHPNLVEAQIEAAYALQSMGPEKPGYYLLAVQGGNKYKEVWGWAELALRVARDEKRKAIFHEARYNLAECHFRLAETKTKEERQAALKQAEADILVIARLYPDMGGKSWYAKYDALLKKIQMLRGVSPVGLSAAGVSGKAPAGSGSTAKTGSGSAAKTN